MNFKRASKPLFSDADRARIADAVTQAETRTEGEVVPMIVRQSGGYKDVSNTLGLVVGFLTLIGLSSGAFWFSHPTSLALMFVPGWLAGFFLGSFPWVIRQLTSQSLMSSKVKARATREFYAAALHETEGRTGILIFVSLLEHEALVLADKGIHEKVPPGTWDDILNRMLAEFKSSRHGDGVVQAVRECGEILARYAPAKPRNPNEIPNRLWIESL